MEQSTGLHPLSKTTKLITSKTSLTVAEFDSKLLSPLDDRKKTQALK